MRYILFVFLTLSLTFSSKASHLVGGELYYDYLGNDQYRITLKLYRDCYCQSCAPFGNVEYVTINTSAGVMYQQIAIPFPGSTLLSSIVNNPCLEVPDVCVEQAVYTQVTTLPPLPGGYELIYQRCCRNAINNIIPDQGATYVAKIPGTILVANSANSTPSFANFPPIFICNNAPLFFDHKAIDADGDVLRYSLTAPFDGASTNCPDPSPASTGSGCPTEPLPYSNLIYQPGYSPTNPTNNPSNLGNMKIDSITGALTCTPNQLGQYVVSVQVDEYRNGVFLGSITRDFQFNVVECNFPIATLPSATIDPKTGLGVYKIECSDSTLDFNPSVYNPPPSNVPLTVHWDFGVPNRTDDTSNQANPSFSYSDTGTYVVTLIVSKEINGEGCYDTAQAVISVYPIFIPDFIFTGDIDSVCPGNTLNLLDSTVSTSGSIVSWFWDFGDGSNSNIANPTKTYNSGGNFPITLTVANARGCSGTYRDTAVIFPKPNADFEASAVCINLPTVFNNLSTVSPGSINTYNWDFAGIGNSVSRTPSYTFTTTGSQLVRLEVTTDKNCKDTVFKAVVVNPLPTVIATPKNQSTCPNSSIQLNAQGASTYVWFPSDGIDNPASANPIFISGLSSTTITLQGIDSNGCSNVDSIRITVYPSPTIDAGLDTSVCLSSGSFRDSVMLVATGAVTYVWSPATGLSDPQVFNPVSRPTVNTTYTVTGIDSNGCSNTDSVRVFFLDPNLNIILEDIAAICENQTATLTVIDQGASSYLWTPADYVSNPTIFNPIFSPPYTYSYVLSISNYCYTKNDTVEIQVLGLPYVDAGMDTTIFRDMEVTLKGFTNGADYYWFPGTYLESPFEMYTIAAPQESQWYYLYAFNAAGCMSVDSVFITVIPVTRLMLPTAFTPNGDGNNDIFRIVSKLNIKSLKTFSVFNRWGQPVFQTTDISQGWDGTMNGKAQQMGTYTWIVKALTKDGEELTESGNVTLLR